MTKQRGNGMVTIPKKKYDQLASRPKPKTLKRDSRQGKLRKGKQGNPYVHTLLSPVTVTGVKIPDVTSFPTSTVQLYDRYEVTVGANPFAVAFTPLVGAMYALNSNLNGATAFAAWTAQAQYTSFNSIYHSYRPVSGCIRAFTTSSSTTNQGEIACALLPKQQSLAAGVMGTFDLIAKRFGAYRSPLKDNLEFLWMPQDPDSRKFQLSNSVTTTGQVSDSWPCIVAGVSGAAAASVVVFEMFWNYELIPEQATLNLVNASAPYISSADMEEATGLITRIGNFGRPLGEDLGSWLLDQGAYAAGEVGKALVAGGIHYVSNRIGLKGGYSPLSVLS